MDGAALWIGPAIVATIISSIVTVGGWFVSHRSEQRLQRYRRSERVRDYQTALLADIRSHRHRVTETELLASLEAVTAQIEQASDEKPFTPFVPRQPASQLWSSIVKEVHVLPNSTIDAVVLFFSQLETINGIVDDLRSDRFRELEKARKIAVHRDYIRLSLHALRLADEAQFALHEALGLPPFSSSGRAPSDPKLASGSVAAVTVAAGKSA